MPHVFPFDDLALELKNEILKHLSAPALFEARLVTKEIYALTYSTLFKRQDENAINYQQKLISHWITNPESRPLLLRIEDLIDLAHQAFKNATTIANSEYQTCSLWLLTEIHRETHDEALQSAAATFTSKLIAFLKDEDDEIRKKACKAIKLAPSLPNNQKTKIFDTLTSLLNSKNVRIEHFDAFDNLLPALSNDQKTKFFDLLITLIKDKSPYTGITVCQALGKLALALSSDKKIKILDELIALSKDENSEVRQGACQGLGILVPTLPYTLQIKICDTLMIRLRHEMLCEEACEVLIKLVPILSNSQKTKILDTLIILLKHKNFIRARQEICRLLGQLAPTLSSDEQIKILDELITLSKNKDIVIRLAACQALGKLALTLSSDEQIKILDELIALSKDEYYEVAQAACQALGKLALTLSSDEQKTKILNTLIALIQNKNPWVRQTACEALIKLTPTLLHAEQIKIRHKLIPLLENKTYWVADACKFLIKFAPMLSNASKIKILDTLISLLGHENWSIRNKAFEALDDLFPILPHAERIKIRDKLIFFLESKTHWITDVCKLLIKFSPLLSNAHKTKILDALLFLSTSYPSFAVREKACRLLGQLAPMLSDDQILKIKQIENSTLEYAILKYMLTLYSTIRGLGLLDKKDPHWTNLSLLSQNNNTPSLTNSSNFRPRSKTL